MARVSASNAQMLIIRTTLLVPLLIALQYVRCMPSGISPEVYPCMSHSVPVPDYSMSSHELVNVTVFQNTDFNRQFRI